MDKEKAKTINKAYYTLQGTIFKRYQECQKQALSMVYNEAYKKGFKDGRSSIILHYGDTEKDAK